MLLQLWLGSIAQSLGVNYSQKSSCNKMSSNCKPRCTICYYNITNFLQYHWNFLIKAFTPGAFDQRLLIYNTGVIVKDIWDFFSGIIDWHHKISKAYLNESWADLTLLQLVIQNIYMWRRLVEKSRVEYEAPVLKQKEEATCLTNTSFALFLGIYYLLKALLQVILILKTSRNNS